MFATKESVNKLGQKVQGLNAATQRAERIKNALAHLTADMKGMQEDLARTGDTAVAAAIFEQFVGAISTGSAVLEQLKKQIATDRDATVSAAITRTVISEILDDIVEGEQNNPRSMRHLVPASGSGTDLRYAGPRRERKGWGPNSASAWDVIAATQTYGSKTTLEEILAKAFTADAMAVLRATCPNEYWMALVARRTIQNTRGNLYSGFAYPEFGQPQSQPEEYTSEHVEVAIASIRFNAPLNDIAGKPVSEWPEAVRMQLTLENGLMLTEGRHGVPPAVIVNPVLQRQLDRIVQEKQQREQASEGDSPRG